RESRWLGHRSAHGGGGRGAGRADLLTAQQAHAKGQEKNQDQEKACSLPPHLCLRKKGTTRRPGFDASYMEVLRRAIRRIPDLYIRDLLIPNWWVPTRIDRVKMETLHPGGGAPHPSPLPEGEGT